MLSVRTVSRLRLPSHLAPNYISSTRKNMSTTAKFKQVCSITPCVEIATNDQLKGAPQVRILPDTPLNSNLNNDQIYSIDYL